MYINSVICNEGFIEPPPLPYVRLPSPILLSPPLPSPPRNRYVVGRDLEKKSIQPWSYELKAVNSSIYSVRRAENELLEVYDDYDEQVSAG